jgi:sulfoxide reductase heme-binding subunit YedZ
VYLFTLVAVSGAARGRLATSARAARAWRSVHALAYVGWAAAMAHGVLAGTDTGTRWSTAVYVACGGAVVLAVALRLRSRARTQSDPLSRARTLERSRS